MLLTTERTVLHPYCDEDGTELLHLFRDPDVRRYLLDDRVVPPAWMQQEIDDAERRFHHHGAGAWSVRLRGDEGDGEIIGFVAFREFTHPPELQLLYGFLPQHQGKGYALEVTSRACQHAFEDLGLGEITAVTDLPNKASAKLLQRLGMELMEITPDGESGTAHYAISRRMWFARQREKAADAAARTTPPKPTDAGAAADQQGSA
ncbi:MAG: GNAT family N-acetyltransferase [Planctomycetes bacterium]|nr:GNAT family N-acetyltransferase [Planctomycetota bacterium]